MKKNKTEEAFWDSDDCFKNIFRAVLDGILILDPEQKRIAKVNEKAAQLLGYSQQKLVGMPIAKIHPKEMKQLNKALKKVLLGQSVQTEEFSCLRQDGHIMPANITLSLAQLNGKKYILAMVRDITERKQAEELVKKLKKRLQEENIYLQNEIKLEHNFDEIICVSEKFKKVLHQVEQVAATDATVLILGETGTGKELLSRAVHNVSSRKERPLVKVNCAALPVNLIESELFGHEKGAFTGALSQRIGRFELADGGTIFLDEIGDLPLELQAKLLRILQEGEFERLGAPKTKKVNVRVIAATNRNLEEAVKKGEFREDLYYRLNVFPIKSLPLRERKEDIPMLVNHFVVKYGKKLGKKIESIPKKTMDILQAYHWPGNVRELENIIERAIILANDSVLELDEQLNLSNPLEDKKPSTLKEMERSLIRKALEESNWIIEGKRGAALRLDISPSTLRDRMKKYKIIKPAPS